MPASTKRFSLTDTDYTDVVEGATLVWFTLEFDRQRYNAIRLHLGQVQPAVDTVHYQGVDPGRFSVGSDEYSQEVPLKFELGAGDGVWLRAERDQVEVVVHRR